MACRKAAYRAEAELSEWMQQQQEQAERNLATLMQQQRQLWTPSTIFETCCPKWLAEGAELLGVGRAGGQPRGCSGGCGKDHPRITLSYYHDDNTTTIHQGKEQEQATSAAAAATATTATTKKGQTVALLSHELDPFVRYFDQLCDKGVAKKLATEEVRNFDTTSSSSCTNNSNYYGCGYYLDGFLQPHLEKLKQSATFGNHLIKVSATALAASKRAHEHQLQFQEELEHEQRRAKRQKLKRTMMMNADDTSNIDNLLECVLEICYQHGCLQEHLDLAELAWMRLTGNPVMTKFASRMILARLQQLQLSYSVLLHWTVAGTSSAIPSRGEDLNLNVFGRNERVNEPVVISSHEDSGRSTFELYNKVQLSREPLSFHRPGEEKPQDTIIKGNNSSMIGGRSSAGRFIPKEEMESCSWMSLPMVMRRADLPPQLPLANNNRESVVGGIDKGVLVRVYMEANATYNFPDKDCLFSELLEVARHRIDLRGVPRGIHRTLSGLTFKVSSVDDEIISNLPEDPDNVTVQFKGRFSVQAIEFNFNDLLGIFVRKKLPLAKQKFQDIKSKRPATRMEKEYVKALAKAARDAPGGSAWAYQGWQGW